MSGNETSLNDDSSRLRDRASSAFQQARETAQRADRLRDRATTAFQQRRQQAARAEERLNNRVDQFAGALGLDPDFVEPVQLDDRGEDIGFVPTDRGRDELASDFAADRPFVEPGDALIDADPVGGTRTSVDPAAFDDVAARARQQSAGQQQFVEPGDLDAEVTPGGVTGVEVRPGRQDDIAARRFESTTALDDVDPTTDLERTGDGFGLSTQARRELGAIEIDEQLPDIDVGVDDIAIEDGQAVFEREVRR